MEKINFSNFNLKMEAEYKTVEYKGLEIKVLQYLPAKDKYDILMITLQEAEEDGIYNSFKLYMYFHLNLFLTYSDNLTFNDDELEDGVGLFDKLSSSGLLYLVLEQIPENEYSSLLEMLNEMVNKKEKNNGSLLKILRDFKEEMPEIANMMQKTVEGFDPQKYQEVLAFAQAANGNRTIEENEPIE